MTCPHQDIATLLLEDTMQPVLWAYKHCGHKFVPLDIGMEQDAARYRWLGEQMKPNTKRKPRLYIAVNDPVNWMEYWALGLGDADAAIDAAMKGTP